MHKETLIQQLANAKSSSIPMWLKRVKPDILQWLEQETKQYSVKNTMERVYIILNGEPPKCLDNNYCKFNTFEKGYRSGCSLGNKCLSVSHDRMTKQKTTMLEKYGVENPSQLESVQQKIKKTNIKKYGTEHHSQNISIKQKTSVTRKQRTKEQIKAEKEKSRLTNIEKYGTDHHMKLVSQQEKVKQTNMIKRGVNYPLQDSASLEKLKKSLRLLDRTVIAKKTKHTSLLKYGVDAHSKKHLSKNTLEILENQDRFIEYVTNKTRKEVTESLEIANHTLYLYAKKYEASGLFIKPLTSKFEIEVAEFLTEYNILFNQNVRNIISPKELDFYIAESNVAIECSGIYWHSEISAGRTSEYHYDKFKKCQEKNIQLITIFEDEWNDKKDIVKALLLNKLLNTKHKIPARKCKLVTITKDTTEEFVNKYHIQGYTSSSVRIGLEYEGNIVAIMTFGKSRFSQKYEWELVRFCSLCNVVGGASKIISYFIKNYNPKNIVSYSDNRWFIGSVYEKLGFKKVNETIGYFYTDYKKRYNRLKFQKHILVKEGYDRSMTEWEIMQQRKFDRIWDCGQVCWELNIER